MSVAYSESGICVPALTRRNPGKRSPPEQISRSTSATVRRSAYRLSSLRETASG
jgi:hypothetical protein